MDFGDFLRAAKDSADMTVLTAEETADVLIDFQPIKDLKVGDRIQRKELYPNNLKGHDGRPVLTVARILPQQPTMRDDGNRVKVFDFTWLERTGDGDIIEWADESRRYERV